MNLNGHTYIGELLDLSAECQAVLASFDMQCLGCPASRGETLEEACDIHGVDLNELLAALQGCLEPSS